MEFSGSVVQRAFAGGTKSERPGVYLITDRAEYLLRRKGGNPFRDSLLESLIGRDIRCEGSLHGYTLIITSYQIIK